MKPAKGASSLTIAVLVVGLALTGCSSSGGAEDLASPSTPTQAPVSKPVPSKTPTQTPAPSTAPTAAPVNPSSIIQVDMTDAQGYAATLTVTDWSTPSASSVGPVATCSREGAAVPSGTQDLSGYVWKVVTISGYVTFSRVNGYTKSTWNDEAGVLWSAEGPGTTSAFFICGQGIGFHTLSPQSTFPLRWSPLPTQPTFKVHVFFGSLDSPNQPGGNFSWIGHIALMLDDTLSTPCESLTNSTVTASTVPGGPCQIVRN